jgi:hypothetical protein
MKTLFQRVKYLLKTMLWMGNGYLGRRFSVAGPQTLTVLITYFDPARMVKINHQLRNILKCSFVERIIISNHNPRVNIQEKIKIKDRRLTVISQTVNRGCGFRWHIASEINPAYLVVIDDDLFIFPEQLTRLFTSLLAEPEIPHGLSGMICLPDGSYEFREKENCEIDFLCEIYAVTNKHLDRYMDTYYDLSSNESVTRIVDSATDFIIISQTGTSEPKIHDVGRLLRDETFKKEGVAVHKGQMFNEYMQQTQDAIGLNCAEIID